MPDASSPTQAALNQILDHVRAEPSRTWSIIITIYGDAIVPRGGSVWLGTLLAFFNAMGLSDGVVRTSVSRLASDGWLERTRVGRNSFYRLADKGRETFRRASEHIYAQRPPAWRGHFEMLFLDGISSREGLREALTDAGFGSPASGVWIAPGGAPVPPEAADSLHVEAQGGPDEARALAARAWPLAQTGEAYGRFLSVFGPLGAALAAGGGMSDLDQLVARVLLIHEYRRIVLRDPLLPAEILPADWPGAAARSLCADIYGALVAGSERWLDAHGVNEHGALPAPTADLRQRFRA